ncbi:YraN family protein [Pseudoflavonifractor sp. MSJ-37]|uniref:YraN family protein n=1 Tax=Pseudoflavonifractor sp. MSJ-37 TaxID=2841531 RepID=UPI001C128511|nr:YraN family protein [Pseudoflavonifractor sp. MSJ-37]MBU5434826.1 YraN family protein [Pseudoflavonifractor sp. MSJ-37]
MSGGTRDEKGRWGEAVTADWLRRQGAVILAERWRCRWGEIDLIAEDETFLRFVEVKLRGGGGTASGLEAVDRRKQARLRTTAELYLSEHPTEKQPRFDVAEVYAPHGMERETASIIYIEDAF